MRSTLLAVLALSAASSAAVAADKEEVFGAAIIQWIEVSCENADELPDRVGAMALGTISQASAEQLKVARQRVREAVAGNDDSAGMTLEQKTEIFCTLLIEKAKQQQVE